MMKIFVINLDKNKERLSKMKAQLDDLGLSFERIPAILGKALSTEEKKRCVNRFLWWCAGGRPVMDGEIGCALSHRSIYRRMISEGIKVACIFEDDVRLDKRLPLQLSRIEKWIDINTPQVVLLSNYTDRSEKDGEIVEERRAIFADGYIITQLAAQAIMKDNFPLRAPADAWTRWIRHGILHCYHAFPAVCHQEWTSDYKSDVCDDKYDPRKFSLVGKIVFKLGRVIGKTIDFVVG